jgi:hypothetical protein
MRSTFARGMLALVAMLPLVALALPQTAAATEPSWKVQSVPIPAGAKSSALAGVSCLTSTSCNAVGNYFTEAGVALGLGVGWAGTEWAKQTVEPGEGALLYATSCTASNACTAVGVVGKKTLAERWNGTEWKIQSTPNPEGVETSTLLGVSCASSEACIAVGQTREGGSTIRPLAEAWNGKTWTIQKTASLIGENRGELKGVSCTSSTACTAVGAEYTRFEARALAQRWNGTEWTAQTPAAFTGYVEEFNSVACRTATSCFAVGLEAETTEGGSTGLIERWNGTTWRGQSIGKPIKGKKWRLTGVSCAKSGDCVAVGDDTTWGAGAVSAPIAVPWVAEVEWQAQELPMPAGAKEGTLEGVSCTAEAACTAVGGYVSSASVNSSMAERYE